MATAAHCGIFSCQDDSLVQSRLNLSKVVQLHLTSVYSADHVIEPRLRYFNVDFPAASHLNPALGRKGPEPITNEQTLSKYTFYDNTR